MAVSYTHLDVYKRQGQHINGRFKHIQASVCADMMEAVSRVAALHIQTEGFSVAVGAALMGVVLSLIHIFKNPNAQISPGTLMRENDMYSL